MNILKRKSIEAKVFIVLISVAVVSVLVVGIIALTVMNRIRERNSRGVFNQSNENIKQIVTLVSNYMDAYLWDIEATAKYTADYVEMILNNPDEYLSRNVKKIDKDFDGFQLWRSFRDESVDKEKAIEKSNLIANVITTWKPMAERNKEFIKSLYLATEDGFMLSYDKIANKVKLSDDGEVYFDFKKREWYTDAKYMMSTVYSKLYDDAFENELILTCSTPIVKDGKFYGVAAVDFYITDGDTDIFNTTYGAGSFSIIIDNEGNVVGSTKDDDSNYKYTSKELNINSPNSKLYDVREKVMSWHVGVTVEDGGNYIGYSPIKNIGWFYCLIVPKETIERPITMIESQMKYLAFGFLIFLILVCIVVAIISKKFSSKMVNPLIHLKKDVEVISKGDFDQKVEIVGNDEVTDLAVAFNNMKFDLKRYIDDLTKVTAEKERISAELNVAKDIQASMLPNEFPAFPNISAFDIFATMNPAKEVGGDFYDFFMIDEIHLAIVVADVSGKGVPAALFMAIGKTLIKDHTNLNHNLGIVFNEVNNILCGSNKEGLFITVYELVINLTTGECEYVNAGHEKPFIYRKNEGYKPLNMKNGFVLAGMEDIKYEVGYFNLEVGDKIFQYTDGVTEATNTNNELYGMERLENVLNNNSSLNPKELLIAVKNDIDKFVGEAPQFDDITMLSFEFIEYLRKH